MQRLSSYITAPMPWIQDHLLSVLELLPNSIEPDDDVPNFHRLKLRIAMIERQHFVLSLQGWIEDNSTWLIQQGLRLQSGRNAVFDGEQTLTYYESFEEDLAHADEGKAERNTQVDRLVDLLDLHSSPLNQVFIEITVEDLNHIRWDPTRARQVLAFKVSDAVSDAYAWLGRHSAARQARSLAGNTPQVTFSPKAPRL